MTNNNGSVYLYNIFGLIGIVLFVVVIGFLVRTFIALLGLAYPPDDFLHLASLGEPSLVAVQHGLIYKPYVTLPLFFTLFFLATTGGVYLQEASNLAFKDQSKASNTNSLIDSITGINLTVGVFSVILLRLSSMVLVVVMALVALLPYGSGFASFLIIICGGLATLTFAAALPFVLIQWRYVVAIVAIRKGNQDARTYLRERAAMSSDDKPKKAEYLPPKSKLETPAAVGTPLMPAATLGALLERMGLRQQKKTTAAYNELKEEMTKGVEIDKRYIKAVSGRERALGEHTDLPQTLEADRMGRENTALDIEEENAAKKARKRQREAAERNPPPAPATKSDNEDPFLDEMANAFKPSRATQIIAKGEREIIALLGGIPEEQATAPLKAIIAERRAWYANAAKDVED